jgi:hypothetical protein
VPPFCIEKNELYELINRYVWAFDKAEDILQDVRLCHTCFINRILSVFTIICFIDISAGRAILHANLEYWRIWERTILIRKPCVGLCFVYILSIMEMSMKHMIVKTESIRFIKQV